MLSDLVTVVIPAHNAARFIEETLTSVLGQTHTNIEVLVVDDGSTDATPEIVAGIAGVDDRVRLIRQAKSGVSAARNRGLEEAQGQWLATVDADDLWRSEKLEKQMAAMHEGGSEVLLVSTWYADIDEQGFVIPPLRPKLLPSDVSLVQVLFQNSITASTPLMRTDAVRDLGGYDVSQVSRSGKQGLEDWKLHSQLVSRGRMMVVPEFLTGYRQVGGSMSRDMVRDLMELYHKAFAEYRSEHVNAVPKQVFIWAEIQLRLWAAARAARDRQVLQVAAPAAQVAWLVLTKDPLIPFSRSARRFSLWMKELWRLRDVGSAQPFGSAPLGWDEDVWRPVILARRAFFESLAG